MTNFKYPPISANPELLGEWHHERNVGIDPSTMYSHSKRKVWWKCRHGHEYEASTDNRSNGKGCPYCAHRKIVESNSLIVAYPEVAAEWHPTRNGLLRPDQVAPKSGKRVWWLCKRGHEWQALVSSRSNGRGCPGCLREKWAEKRSRIRRRPVVLFADKRPDLVDEWNYPKNTEYDLPSLTIGSKRKVWWLCKRGHEWQASIGQRVNLGSGCPLCGNQSSRKEMRLYTELRAVLADSPVEWRARIEGIECDIYLPRQGLGIEFDGSYWHRNKGEIDLRKSIELEKRGISVVRVRDESLGVIDANTVLIREDQDDDYSVVKMVLARILSLRKFTEPVVDRIRTYMATGRLVADDAYKELVASLPGPLPGRSLADLNPNISAEWHYERNYPLRPESFHPKSGTKVWWVCFKGHEWETSIALRVSQDQGCPFCSGVRASEDYSLRVSEPTVSCEWHPTLNGELTPEAVTPRSSKIVWWRCANGHEWRASINNRVRRRASCPYCAGKLATPERNLLAAYPDVAAEWNHGKNGTLKPTDVTPRSSRKVWWSCKRGHEWQASISNRTAGRGCRFCAGRKK